MGHIPYSGLPAHRLVFYTIGRVPSRIHTILHSSFVLRQPPPHHIHASEFSQARWYPDQPRNFSALRRYVGRIRFFIHSRSQPNNYYSSCRFRTAHRKDHFCRLTLRAAARQEVTPMVQTVGLEPTTGNQRRERCVLYRLSYVCIEGGARLSEPPDLFRALSPPGGAEAPPIRKRRGKRKKMEMQSLPLHLP